MYNKYGAQRALANLKIEQAKFPNSIDNGVPLSQEVQV